MILRTAHLREYPQQLSCGRELLEHGGYVLIAPKLLEQGHSLASRQNQFESPQLV